MNNYYTNLIYMAKKSWVVLSPRRTGSGYICSLIRGYYRHHYQTNINIIDPLDSANLNTIPEKTIVHAHDLKTFDLAGDHIQFVLSTRNLADSALSWCITLQTSGFHFYRKQFSIKKHFLNKFFDKPLVTPHPFVLDPNRLLKTYGEMQYWYNHIPQHIKEKSIIIDYPLIETDPRLILDKLGLNEKRYDPAYFNTTIRATGQHYEWIKNWDEISEVVKNLPAQDVWQ